MRSLFGSGDETQIVNGSKTAVCHDEIFPSIDKFPLKTLKLHTCMCHSSCKVSLHVRCKSWAKAVLCLNEVQGYSPRGKLQTCFLHWGENITLNGNVHSFREKVSQPQRFSTESKTKSLQFIYQRFDFLKAFVGRHPAVPVWCILWARIGTKLFLLFALC